MSLLAVLKTEEEIEEDIEDRIARYRIIEEKIQSFQEKNSKMMTHLIIQIKTSDKDLQKSICSRIYRKCQKRGV